LCLAYSSNENRVRTRLSGGVEGRDTVAENKLSFPSFKALESNEGEEASGMGQKGRGTIWKECGDQKVF
jgi:hypothetical protein